MNKRKTFLFAILAILVLASGVAGAQARLSPWEKDALSKTHIEVDGQKVPIYYGGPTYYITSDFRTGKYLYVHTTHNLKNKLLQIGDNIYETEFSSSAPDVASIDEYGMITFHSEGDVIFKVVIGDYSTEIPVQVLEGPYIISEPPSRRGIPLEDVVKRLGFPDRRTSATIVWPDRSAILDNIFYFVTGTDTHTIVHWHYDEYPTLIFRIVDNSKLYSIDNAGWECGYSSRVERDLGIDPPYMR